MQKKKKKNFRSFTHALSLFFHAKGTTKNKLPHSLRCLSTYKTKMKHNKKEKEGEKRLAFNYENDTKASGFFASNFASQATLQRRRSVLRRKKREK